MPQKLEPEQTDLLLKIVTGILILVIILSSVGFYSVSKQQKESETKLSTAISDYNGRIDALQIVDQSLINDLTSINEELGLVKNESDEQKKKIDQSKSQLEQLGVQVEGIGETVEGLNDVSTDFAKVVKEVINSVVSIKTDVGQGSGVIVTEDGYVITNFHVISGATAGAIYTYDDRAYPFKIITHNSIKDLAVLKIGKSDEDFSYLSFADSDGVDIGDRVIAIGNPGGFSSTVTQGIVSSVNRKGENHADYVQTDVSISPGNSGGPLISTDSKIVGINTWKIAAAGFEGIGFALESDEVVQFAEPIIRQDKNDTSWGFD